MYTTIMEGWSFGTYFHDGGIYGPSGLQAHRILESQISISIGIGIVEDL